MIITYELRAWAREHRVLVGGLGLEEIADRIDQQHERALAEQRESLTVDMKPMTDESMAEHGWVKLPKDADGEPIHLQDRMSWDNGTFNVHELNLTADGWTTWDELHGYTVRADQCHHVQPDSWERIIEDAGKANLLSSEWGNVQADLVERCKRLAGEDA